MTGSLFGDETQSGSAGPATPDQGALPAFEVGAVVAGDYRIEGQLGAGGMGIVMLARHLRLDRHVALKALTSLDPASRERIGREATAMAKLDHPNVVRIFDARQEADRLYIVMECIRGGTLRHWCSAHKRTPRQIVDKFCQAARGLQAAHASGLVHRDFKPDNVLVAADGTAKVADFGIVRDAASNQPGTPNLTGTGAIVGTPAYMAPEQFDGRPDTRSDQYAFCVALFEALYGQRPFPGPGPAQFLIQSREGLTGPPPPSNVPAGLFEVLRRGLSPDPNQRYRDMGQLVDRLRAALRRPAVVTAAIVGVGLVALGIGALVLTRLWSEQGEDSGTSAVEDVEVVAVPQERLVVPEDPKPLPIEPPPPVELTPYEASEPQRVERDDLDRFAFLPANLEDADHFPFYCNKGTHELKGQVFERPAGPVVLVEGDCHFECKDCTVRGTHGVNVLGEGQAVFIGGSIESALIKDRGRLELDGVEVFRGGMRTLYVIDEGTLSIRNAEIQGGVTAEGTSTLSIESSSLTHESVVLSFDRDITFTAKDVRYQGGIDAPHEVDLGKVEEE